MKNNIFIKDFIHDLIDILQLHYNFDEIRETTMNVNSIYFSKLLKTDYLDIQVSGGIDFEIEKIKNNIKTDSYRIKDLQISLYKDLIINDFSYFKDRLFYTESKEIILNQQNIYKVINNLIKLFRNKMIILDRNLSLKLEKLMKVHEKYISK